jgi:hypothetical protein
VQRGPPHGPRQCSLARPHAGDLVVGLGPPLGDLEQALHLREPTGLLGPLGKQLSLSIE